MNEAKEPAFFEVDSSLVIAVVTAYTYLITYDFQTSYCQAFGIASDFINVDLTTYWIFLTNSVIGLGILGIFFYLSGEAKFSKLKRHPNFQILALSTLEGLILTISWFFLVSKMVIYYPWTVVVFFVFATILFFILKKSKQGTENVQDDTSRIRNFKDLRKFIDAQKPVLYGGIIFASIFFYFALDGAAYFQAEFEDHFSRLQNNKELIIIKKYGDDLLCKRYDYKHSRFLNSIIVVKINDTKPYVFEDVYLKPLRVQTTTP